MQLSILLGWGARGLVVIFSLLNTRLFIEVIGVNGIAAYSIIMSLTVWIYLLNFGIPQGVQNLISKYRAENKSYDTLKNTSYITIIFIFILFLPAMILIGILTSEYLLRNYIFINQISVIIACILIFISGLGAIFNQILYAEHKSIFPNIYPSINVILICGILFLFKRYSINDFNTVLVAVNIPGLVIFIIGANQLKVFKNFNYDFKLVREIWNSSRGYLQFSFLSATTLAVDYLIMSQILNPEGVAEYNILSRIFLTILTIHAVVLATTWSKISDLMYAKKNTDHVIKLILIQGFLLTVICGGLIMYYIDPIIETLTVGKINHIEIAVCISWFIYILTRVWCDTFAMALLSTGNTTAVNKYIPFQALISIICQWILGQKYGVSGIVIGLTLSFVLTAVWILPIQFYKKLDLNEAN